MTFLEEVAEELKVARTKHTPIASLHEGYAVILEEMDEFKEEVWKRLSKRDRENMWLELKQIAAMCARTAEDCL